MKSTNAPAEDFEQFINETIRLNQCCPRFNNILPRFLESVDKDAPLNPADVEKYAIPAVLRKKPASR